MHVRFFMLALVLPAVAILVTLLIRRKFGAAAILGAVFVGVGLYFSYRMEMGRSVWNMRAERDSEAATIAQLRSQASSPAVEAAFVPPAPRPGVPAIVAPDDFTPWLNAQTLVTGPSAAPGQEWIQNAAGAQYVREAVGVVDCIYWKPGADNLLAAYSGLEATPGDAERGAEETAAQKVGVLGLRAALPKLSPQGPRWESGRDGLRWDERSISDMRVLAAKLARATQSYATNGAVMQEITRPYGNLFRYAVRVSVDPRRIEDLGQRIADQLRSGYLSEQSALRGFAFAVAGLFVLLVGLFSVYCLFRAGTTGIFAWPLRLVALMVLAILGAAVYLLGTHGV